MRQGEKTLQSGTAGQKTGVSYPGHGMWTGSSFVWLTGAAGMLGIRSVQYQILKKKVLEASVPCRDTGITAMICSICGEISVKDRVRVRISREIKTPMLFGYSKPIIVLPHRRYHEEEAEMILRHEIQHYKNRDLWYKFLIMFVCDLYWFNPVLRLMKKAAYQDIECICDEKVVRRLDLKGKKIYASTILETAARGKREVVFGTHFSRGKRSVETRIRNIFTRKNKWGYVFSAFLTAAVIGGTCLWNIRENGGQQAYDDSLDPGEAAGTRFYIDSGSVLWGYGGNDYGQLGNGQVDELGVVYWRRCCARGRASSNDRIRDVSGSYRTGPDRRRCGVCEGRNAVHCISEK